MATETTDHYSAGADDEHNQKQTKETKKENQNLGVPQQPTNPPDQQPSGSQHNEWQQDHGKESMDNRENNPLSEARSQPSPQYRASEDDELGEEMANDDKQDGNVKENSLEFTDQDYRDGVNQSAEDQDDADELRNGK